MFTTFELRGAFCIVTCIFRKECGLSTVVCIAFPKSETLRTFSHFVFNKLNCCCFCRKNGGTSRRRRWSRRRASREGVQQVTLLHSVPEGSSVLLLICLLTLTVWSRWTRPGQLLRQRTHAQALQQQPCVSFQAVLIRHLLYPTANLMSVCFSEHSTSACKWLEIIHVRPPLSWLLMLLSVELKWHYT